jgi:hypothetical protein
MQNRLRSSPINLRPFLAPAPGPLIKASADGRKSNPVAGMFGAANEDAPSVAWTAAGPGAGQ